MCDRSLALQLRSEQRSAASRLKSAAAFLFALLLCAAHSSGANSPTSSSTAMVHPPAGLAGYTSLASYAVSSTRWTWNGDQAVAKKAFALRFVRGLGWYVIENDELTETHTWKDQQGCHALSFDVRSQPQGFYQQQNTSCNAETPHTLSPSLESSILSWLLHAPSGFLPLASCASAGNTLNCTQKNLKLIAELSGGRLSRAHFQTSEGGAFGYVSSVEFVESAAANLKLAPDLAALGLVNMVLGDAPLVVLAQAAKGDITAARQVLMLLATGQLPEAADPSQIQQALEALYRAKVAGADFYSAQLYAKAAAPYRAAALKQLSASQLRAEFKKRMTEAAMACNVAALSRMEEGCLESGCENDTPHAAIALLSNSQQRSCERKQAQRTSRVKRPLWTQKALP